MARSGGDRSFDLWIDAHGLCRHTVVGHDRPRRAACKIHGPCASGARTRQGRPDRTAESPARWISAWLPASGGTVRGDERDRPGVAGLMRGARDGTASLILDRRSFRSSVRQPGQNPMALGPAEVVRRSLCGGEEQAGWWVPVVNHPGAQGRPRRTNRPRRGGLGGAWRGQGATTKLWCMAPDWTCRVRPGEAVERIPGSGGSDQGGVGKGVGRPGGGAAGRAESPLGPRRGLRQTRSVRPQISPGRPSAVDPDLEGPR